MNEQYNYYGFTDSRFVIVQLTHGQSRNIIPKYHQKIETRTAEEQNKYAKEIWRDRNNRPQYKSNRGLELFDLKHCHKCDSTMCECVK